MTHNGTKYRVFDEKEDKRCYRAWKDWNNKQSRLYLYQKWDDEKSNLESMEKQNEKFYKLPMRTKMNYYIHNNEKIPSELKKSML